MLDSNKEKRKNTNIIRYGFECQFIGLKEQIKNTNIKLYGNECFTKTNLYQQKILYKSHNINGFPLTYWYKKNNIKVSYTCYNNNYLLFGNVALTNEYYLNKRKSRTSKIANRWLNFIEEKLGYKLEREYKIGKYYVDGFDPNTNTIYEFYGDYWHGNLNCYNSNDINKNKNMTFNELYNETILRENELKSFNHNFVFIWEFDYLNSIIQHN